MYYEDSTVGLIDAPDDKWKPVYWTERKYEDTLGDAIIDFVEQYMSPPRKFNDDPFKLAEWQKWLYRHVFELKPDGTFRYKEVYIQVPRKNGKSMFMSHCIGYWLAKANDGDEFYLAAKDSKQADVLFREIKRNIQDSADLSLILDVKRDIVSNKFKNVFCKKLSSSATSTFGFAPYISVGDELCMWDGETGTSKKGQDMITSLTTGSGDRPEYMFIGITTAGSNTEGLAYGRYEKGKMISTGSIEDDSFGFFCWEAEEFDDINDPKTWLKANPSLAEGIMPMDQFEESFNSQMILNPADFERYRLNKWIKSSASENFIAPFYWREAEDISLGNIPEGAEVAVGFDGSLTEDSTGIVAIDMATGLMEVLHKWEKDPTVEDWYVDVGEIDVAMADVFKKYNVGKVYADPSRHHDLVKGWQRTYGQMVVRDIPPTAIRMQPMGDEFVQDLYTGLLKHNGEKRFTQHVMNAVKTARGLPAKEKRNSHKKIDFLVCAILANGARRELIDVGNARQKTAARYGK